MLYSSLLKLLWSGWVIKFDSHRTWNVTYFRAVDRRVRRAPAAARTARRETAMELPRKAMASSLVVWLLLAHSCKHISLVLLPLDVRLPPPGEATAGSRIVGARRRPPAGAVRARSRRLLGPGPRPLPLLLQDGQVQGGVRGGPLRRRALQARVPLPAAPLRVSAPAVRSGRTEQPFGTRIVMWLVSEGENGCSNLVNQSIVIAITNMSE